MEMFCELSCANLGQRCFEMNAKSGANNKGWMIGSLDGKARTIYLKLPVKNQTTHPNLAAIISSIRPGALAPGGIRI